MFDKVSRFISKAWDAYDNIISCYMQDDDHAWISLTDDSINKIHNEGING